MLLTGGRLGRGGEQTRPLVRPVRRAHKGWAHGTHHSSSSHSLTPQSSPPRCPLDSPTALPTLLTDFVQSQSSDPVPQSDQQSDRQLSRHAPHPQVVSARHQAILATERGKEAQSRQGREARGAQVSLQPPARGMQARARAGRHLRRSQEPPARRCCRARELPLCHSHQTPTRTACSSHRLALPFTTSRGKRLASRQQQVAGTDAQSGLTVAQVRKQLEPGRGVRRALVDFADTLGP